MKLFFLTFLFLFLAAVSSFAIFNQKTDVTEIRKQMLRAINSSKVTDSLYINLKPISKKTPLVTAYIGALEALKAKNSWNPYNKIKYLNLSGKTVQQAVNASPNDMEIRFVRFSIQSNLPHFLGLNKDLEADKTQIIQQLKQKHYGTADKVFVQNIIKFMINSKQCTAQEIGILNEQSAVLK
ncbi:hypothetical protein [Mucilaginibacter arboris]|uniref:Uncharacterized protein n=1 Tax=Mucilaginibacter arboris TaxID=2682090 RepID=A0A7K1T166_9SPHI|nr:hypothetical protein [Mucilaginibacter arboris]MVN23322.1 hypothetical protein [Mucilaginibacter arboris]